MGSLFPILLSPILSYFFRLIHNHNSLCTRHIDSVIHDEEDDRFLEFDGIGEFERAALTISDLADVSDL